MNPRPPPSFLLAIPTILAAAAPVGADVLNVNVLQSRFLDSACTFPEACGGPCTVLLLSWTETSPNGRVADGEGLDVVYDGQLLTVVDGLPQASLPGNQILTLAGLPSGRHRFRVGPRRGTSSGEAEITVLTHQPFPDPAGLACQSGAPGEAGRCELQVEWTRSGPAPTSYSIRAGGVVLGEAPGDALSHTIAGVAPGEHCVEVVAFLSNGEGTYRGCPIRSCCQIECAQPPEGSFVRGICDGIGSQLLLTQAIFALNHLFASGPAPPCELACDVNDDGRFDLTDPLQILNFLFRGGGPPAGWGDDDGDGVAEPRCVSSAAGPRCQSPGPPCAEAQK
jgi:hypothetical protein